MPKQRVITGLQPSGAQLHIGNYLGAIKPLADFQEDKECFICVVNYHALTTVHDAKLLSEQTLEAATEYLACGVDPNKTTLFIQSDVPELHELTWIFKCITPMGLLERAVAYKDKVANGIEPSVGLFTYPALMAADILAYQIDLVPVGKDQKQHVEIARDIAEKFNHTFGEAFVLPEAVIPEELATIPGVDGRKMSKSYGNFIGMFEEEKSILKKIKGIVTDSKGVGEPKETEGSTIFRLFELLATESETEEMRKRFAEGIGYGDAKEALYEVFLRSLKDVRERYTEFKANPDLVRAIFARGGQKAREDAVKTLTNVRKLIGII